MGTEFIIVLSTYSVVLRSVLTKEAFICPIHGYFNDTLRGVGLPCGACGAHLQQHILIHSYLQSRRAYVGRST